MPPDKPLKLLPETVRTFLELGLKYVINEQKSIEEKEQMKSSIFKFVKMICVSNSYLNCSRRTNLDIYRLNLSLTRNVSMVWISLSSKSYDFSDKSPVFLAYDDACKLIKLLLPSYTGVYFFYWIAITFFKQQSELLKLLKGKIGFYLLQCRVVGFAQNMLKTFADRIHELHCPIERLTFDKSLQFPILDYLYVDSLGYSDQFYCILQQKVKKLEIAHILSNFEIGNESLADPKNETVKSLKLYFGGPTYVKIEKLLEYFCKSCLNLKYLDVSTYNYYESSANQILDKVVAYIRCMNTLKTRFENYLVSVHINFVVQIHTYDELNETWIKTVCNCSALNGWKTKSDKDVHGRDTLETTFDSTGCKLEMSIIVSSSNL